MSTKHFEQCQNIRVSSLAILSLISPLSRAEFISDPAAVRAARGHLRVIRKAARSIPESFRDAHPEVRWESLSAIRIVFFHEYYGIEVDAVWEIFKRTIAGLAEDMQGIMKSEE